MVAAGTDSTGRVFADTWLEGLLGLRLVCLGVSGVSRRGVCRDGGDTTPATSSPAVQPTEEAEADPEGIRRQASTWGAVSPSTIELSSSSPKMCRTSCSHLRIFVKICSNVAFEESFATSAASFAIHVLHLRSSVFFLSNCVAENAL